MVWGQLASAGFGALGALSGRKAAKQQRRIAKEDRNVAGTAYEPINVAGLGGAGLIFGGAPGYSGGYGGADYSGTLGGKKSGRIQDLGGGYRKIGRYTIQSDINNAQLSLGDLEPFRQGLVGMGGDVLGGFGQVAQGQALQGLAPELALSGLGQIYGGMDQLNAISPMAGAAYGQSFGDIQALRQSPFGQAVMQGAMDLGGQNLMRAGQSFDQQYQDTLGLLRESARPGEELAGANFLQRMFDTGGRATSGGAMQTQQFAQGLAQADTARQLQALGEARAQQTQALNVGQSLVGTGQDIRGLQDQLLGSATSRFGALGELNQQLAQGRYQMGVGMGGYAAGLGQMGSALQSQPYQNLQNYLGGLSGLQSYAMQPAELAMTMMNQQAASRLGQVGAGSAGINAPAAANASLFGALSGVDWGGTFGQLGNLFGGGGGGGSGADAAINWAAGGGY